MTDTTTYTAKGRLDATNAATVETELLALLGSGGGQLQLDLAGLDYISSAGLRVLLVVAKAAKAKGGKLSLRAPQPQVLEVIRISGFDRILPIV